MSNIFHDNVNVTITINAIIIRSITLFHCIYMVGINSFEIKKLRHWQLQKKLRLAVSVLCLIALSSNFTTFILRSSNSVSSLDTAVETCVTNFENVLDIFYNFCFNGCLLTLLICSLDRYKRIVLSDHEISVMKAQAALDQTLPRLKRRIWLNGFT